MKEKAHDDGTLWFKDAIIYEVHVRAFGDSNGDGIGDFRGLTQKLDYLQRLGVTAVWLLPFYPSPLRDDGYDISDYFNIHPDYGKLRDFKDFLKAAHQRGIKVIAELVLNHTSAEHSWFTKARQSSPNSKSRNMYVWSNTAEKYTDARIIFKDFEVANWTWDSVAKAYYWHRFYSHQPDLNFDNPSVHNALFRVIDFWYSLGVDGLRLDAVPYLYERDGTHCENLPETHGFLKKLRHHVDHHFKGKMLLAEANQWPEDAAAYFGNGDECHMCFHFPLMPRMFMAIQMEDSFPIIDIIKSTPQIPATCQWGTFLRNHDELTLEMVTDEERDYMYRVYAKDSRAKINLGIRRRLAPLLGNDRRKIELMNILLFSLPGTPIIYYGDEIGMGDNYYLGDRNGVRTPMQWGPDRNAGFSYANPHSLYLPVVIDPEYHYEAINVQNQAATYTSLLWWMRGIIATRKRFKAFSRGTMEILSSDNPKVFAFNRVHDDEIILVVTNLSRFSQVVTLDLSDYVGMVPEEVFGRSTFPIIKDVPYLLTMGPYQYFWLRLEKNKEIVDTEEDVRYPVVHTQNSWEEIFGGVMRQRLEENILPAYLLRSRWFGAKTRKITRVVIEEDARVGEGMTAFHLLILHVSYSEGAEERYLVPVSFAVKTLTGNISEEYPQSIIAEVYIGDTDGLLFDGTYYEELHNRMFEMIARRKKIKGTQGTFMGQSGKELRVILGKEKLPLVSKPLKAEQSNTAIMYNDKFFLKLYRRLEVGVNPELEIMRYLGMMNFPHIPPFAGSVEFRMNASEPLTVAILQGYVENSGNAWQYTQNVVSRYFEQILSRQAESLSIPKVSRPLMDISLSTVPSVMRELAGELFLEMMDLLGRRTAQLHCSLCSSTNMPEFDPEPFSQLYQRSMYQSMQSLVQRTFLLLTDASKKIPKNVRSEVQRLLPMERKLLDILRRIVRKKVSATKIRIHGDYHLGQVLYTGKDFVIMDFEGEPARPLSERRLKRSPFRDVAGMIRSFHYVAYSSLLVNTTFRPEDIPVLEPWIEPWYHYISGIFLNAYLSVADGAPFVPNSRDEVELLLHTFLLEKATYEIGYEMNNRPGWVMIPIRGIEKIIEEAED